MSETEIISQLKNIYSYIEKHDIRYSEEKKSKSNFQTRLEEIYPKVTNSKLGFKKGTL